MDQHVKGATHEKGHTLDLILSRNSDPTKIKNVRIMDQISYHFTVNFTVSLSAPNLTPKVISFRKIKDIDIDAFSKDIENTDIVVNFQNISDLDVLVERYNTSLRGLLDIHAPVIQKRIISKLHAPWHQPYLLDLLAKRVFTATNVLLNLRSMTIVKPKTMRKRSIIRRESCTATVTKNNCSKSLINYYLVKRIILFLSTSMPQIFAINLPHSLRLRLIKFGIISMN